MMEENSDKGVFSKLSNLSLLTVYQKVVHGVMFSPDNAKKELSRDGDAELFEALLSDEDSELTLFDLAVIDPMNGYSSYNPESLRRFMFNMQRDMTEKVARYMNEITLRFDREEQFTTFQRKEIIFNHGIKS